MSLLASTLLILGAYLAGSIPFAMLIGRARGVDIRRSGSGNIGATNLARALGRKWGIIAFVLDYSKGLVPVLAAGCWVLHPTGEGIAVWLPVATGAAAVLGHVFPVYLRFRGGKGVATAFGVMTALSWPATAAAAALWLLLFLLTRTVSMASIAAALALPAGVALFARHSGHPGYLAEQVLAVVLAALILVRHRANIMRLWKGEELRFR
jgi:glycerol-3-phosphate acyltransferase PlsY